MIDDDGDDDVMMMKTGGCDRGTYVNELVLITQNHHEIRKHPHKSSYQLAFFFFLHPATTAMMPKLVSLTLVDDRQTLGPLHLLLT